MAGNYFQNSGKNGWQLFPEFWKKWLDIISRILEKMAGNSFQTSGKNFWQFFPEFCEKVWQFFPEFCK